MKILMRGAIDPLLNMSSEQFIFENHTGGNIGNMIFTNSITRSLLVDDNTTIDYFSAHREKPTKAWAERVNATYDYFLIPLANAFKVKNHEELTLLRDFVKLLKIPCCVIGVGIQRQLSNQRFSKYYKYNDEARDFCKAVLEKSPMIGVRGEITGEFLKDLGFMPERDYTVIGCPSMFTWGDTLPEVKKTILTKDSVVAFNSKIEFETLEKYQPFLEFEKKSMAQFPNMIYVQQQIDDIRMSYIDGLKPELQDSKIYDLNKAVTFTNIPGWIDYFKKNVDFSFGSRIHGNVAAVLAGVPSLIVPFDQRVWELAKYHNIPMLLQQEIGKKETLFDLFERTDFDSVHKGHKERFAHYHDFLHKTLGLDTIYEHTYADDQTPYDKIAASREYPGVVRGWDALTDEEKIERGRSAALFYRARFKEKNERLMEAKQTIRDLSKEKQQIKRHPFQWAFRQMKRKLRKKLGLSKKKKGKKKKGKPAKGKKAKG
ncbi:MAG: polysaccharide pyruvyl transferase family protein [Clostridia bacterium]|nr:polysaccharide pyruvyl transferase family protein [Clostridia bacterium]